MDAYLDPVKNRKRFDQIVVIRMTEIEADAGYRLLVDTLFNERVGPAGADHASMQLMLGVGRLDERVDPLAPPNQKRAKALPTHTRPYKEYFDEYTKARREFDGMVEGGGWEDWVASGIEAMYDTIVTDMVSSVAGARTTTVIPKWGGGTEAVAGAHALLDGGSYTNVIPNTALDATQAGAMLDAFSKEKKPNGELSNPAGQQRGRYLVGSSFSTTYQVTRSPAVDSATTANPGMDLQRITLPGLGTVYAVVYGKRPTGPTIEFAGGSIVGRPKVDIFEDRYHVVHATFRAEYTVIWGSWVGWFFGDSAA